jgi:hypothetical protein
MSYPLSEQQMYGLSFEQSADNALGNASFFMGRSATDLRTLYDYKPPEKPCSFKISGWGCSVTGA